MTRPLTCRCPAKVNLALRVGPPRDDGFHPIASWMVAVSLYDELTIAPASTQQSTFSIDWAGDALRADPIDWPIEKDLVFRAHRLIEQHIGRSLPVAVTLRKRIPIGGGLAGGSSDGAAMLRALNEMFDLKLPSPTLIDLAMELGSDLAFFLDGPSAVVAGRGERITPVPRCEPVHLVLAIPPFGCPTGAVYRAFDEMIPSQPVAADPVVEVDEKAVWRVATMQPLTPDAPFNDLAKPACRVQPALATLCRRGEQAIGRPVHITGSGSGLFVVADDADHARQLAGRLAPLGDLVTVTVRSLSS